MVKALTAESLRSVPRSQRGGHGEQVPTVALAVPLREREFSARRLWHTPTDSPCAGRFKPYHGIVDMSPYFRDRNKQAEASPDFCAWNTALILASGHS